MIARGPRLRFRLLGSFGVWRDGRWLAPTEIGSRKGRTLLEILLVEAGRVVPVDRLAEHLWGNGIPDLPHRQVATLVSRLRRVLGAEVIAGHREGYRFAASPHAVLDLDEAGALVGEAEQRLAAEPALALAAAGGALDLLGEGEVLQDEPSAEWAEVARARALELLRRARRAVWRAGLELGDHARVVEAAERAAAAEPLDEEPVRALMHAYRSTGRSAQALAAFERLRVALAEELGVDPSPETAELHLAILRGAPMPAVVEAAPRRPVVGRARREEPWRFVGREAELGVLDAAWASAVAGDPRSVLLVGEAGIGKTRLGHQLLLRAERTGGWVLEAGCFEAERSLFLQPVADAVRSLALRLPPDRLRTIAGDSAGPLAQLVPEVGRILRPTAYAPAPPEIERRRAFDAVVELVRALAALHPTVLFLDDLHLAGASTIELLHYLVRRVESSPFLLLGTVRAEEGEPVLEQLAGVSEVLRVGPLPAADVEVLAEAIGRPQMAAAVAERTRGHPLFAVEVLRAPAEAGAEGKVVLPETLLTAVVERVRRAGGDVEDLVRAGAVLGSAFDLDAVAALLEVSPEEAIRRADRAHRAGLLEVSGREYAFSNDLIREILYVTSPEPARVERHRRAVRFFEDPEVVAVHATAAQEWATAARSWLEAGSRAAGRAANREAADLLDRALDAAREAGDPSMEARVRQARGAVREALSDFAGSYEDHLAAAEWARGAGEAELEMAALRSLGGDPLIGMGRPVAECIPFLEAALELAERLEDRQRVVDVLTRLAVLRTNRLRFDLAHEHAERALAVARGLGRPESLALALDGRKTVAAYSGDLATLRAAVAELEPLLRRARLLQHLQWAVFESSFVPFAAGRWEEAERRIGEAVELNRRVGFHAYGAMFTAQVAWVRLAAGDLGGALAHAREAFETAEGFGHPWWRGFSGAILGWALTEAGSAQEAGAVLGRALAAAEANGAESYVVRCLAHLALAAAIRGEPRAAQLAGRAEGILGAAGAPPGGAFLHGAHATSAVARARLRLGEPELAIRLLEPLREAAAAAGWCEPEAEASLLLAVARGELGEAGPAGELARRAAETADSIPIPRLAWRANGALARLARRTGVEARAVAREGSARDVIGSLARTIPDRGERERFRRFARSELRCLADPDVPPAV